MKSYLSHWGLVFVCPKKEKNRLFWAGANLGFIFA